MAQSKITERTGERFARLAFELEGLSARLAAGDMRTEARGAKAMAAEARNISNGILTVLWRKRHRSWRTRDWRSRPNRLGG